MVTSEPWRVFWHGKAIVGATPMQCRFLYLLLARESVPHSSFEMMTRADDGRDVLKVHMVHLRKLLRFERIGFEIENIYGWGYRLVEREIQ